MASADRLIEVFNEAKARSVGAEREHFLAEACQNEPELKAQVLALLQAHEGAGDFLKHTEFIPPTAPLTEKPGDRIGRYKLPEQIGEGGCGVVYMAEQEEPVRRRVALKVIKFGMDTKQVIARFEAERQALALMDHPNIAKVLDGGATDTGRPFFVMELVRGIKITDYCDQNNLSTNERLGLFIQACQAIQHAHQKGIIHRDIKPSNILVTQHDHVAVPKVIDFGIAKATVGQLTDKTVFTAFAQFIGTPAYMSPEQAQMSGLDIDTRADIYSLGILLYELLTGHTPFDAKELLAAGMDEMRRKIREDEPAKPSTRLSTMQAMDLTTVARHRHVEAPRLIHLLRGDLDWLVMKCLEKDRTRRYETANALAMDLQRHMNDEPVVARPPSRSYRFQKLVRRNKLAFAAGGAVAAALVLGLGVATWALVRERAARARAEDAQKATRIEATKSRQVALFLQAMLKGVGPSVALGRDTKMLREILDNTAERVGKDLRDQPEVEAELRSTIGGTYLTLGDFNKAEAMQRESLRLRKLLLGGTNELVAASLNDLARVLVNRGTTNDLPEAEAMVRLTLAMRKQLLGGAHPEVANSLYVLASALQRQGRLAEAETTHREGLAMRRKLLGNEHRDVASSLDNLAVLLHDQGKLAEAETMVREALATQRKLVGNEHPDVGWSLRILVGVLDDQGKLAEAEIRGREALAMNRKLFGNEHRQVADVLASLAHVLQAQGKLAGAEAVWREWLAMEKKLSGEEHPLVANSLHRLAVVLRASGKWSEAEATIRESLSMRRKLLGNDDPTVVVALSLLGATLSDQSKHAEAEAVHREELVLRRKLPVDDSQLAVALAWLTSSLLAAQKFSEAEPPARECLSIREKKLPDDWLTFNARAMLGDSLLGQKKYSEAEPLLLSGYEGMKQREDKHRSKVRLRESLQRLVQLYEATGQSEKAAEWNKKLAEFDKADAGKKAAAPKP